MRLVSTALLVVLFFAAGHLAADVPNIINFQGYLTDGSNPVDGSVEATFRIYDAASGGNVLWLETRSLSVNEGYYTVLLGEITPVEITFDGNVWIGVQITGQSEMSPRYQITSTPYAYTSKYADSTSAISNNSIDSTKIKDGTIVTDDFADNAITKNKLASDIIDSTKVENSSLSLLDIGNGGASAGQTIKWSGAEWTPADDEVGSGSPGEGWADDGTVVRLSASSDSVGIGTALPNARFEVSGDVKFSGRITGGTNITNDSAYSVVLGGDSNKVYGQYSAIVSGANNLDSSTYSIIGGGIQNRITGYNSYHAIGGGYNNLIFEDSDSGSVIGGGMHNDIYETNSAIAGGYDNFAYGGFDFIGGGYYNRTMKSGISYSTIGGGYQNMTQDTGAAVAGGYTNNAAMAFSFIGGGISNAVYGSRGTIVGGGYNAINSSGLYSFIGGGNGNIIDSSYSAIVGGMFNRINGYLSYIGGGREDSISGNFSTIGGGYRNRADSSYTFIGGGGENKSSGDYTTIGGGQANEMYHGHHSFIGGGYQDTIWNGYYSFIGGGYGNLVAGNYTSVPCGYGNRAFGDYDVVAGGYDNRTTTAGNTYCVIGGGRYNYVNGVGGVIPGGDSNTVMGFWAFAAGVKAQAMHNNSFVWNGSNSGAFASSDTGQFLINAPGGVGICTDSLESPHKLHVNGLAKFEIGGGSIAMSTPGGWPGIISYSPNGNRRDIIYRNEAMYIVASDSSWAPGLNNGITIYAGGNVGIKNTSPSYELDVSGDIRCVSLTETSDIRLKSNITKIENALDGIMHINGVKFDWDEDSFDNKALAAGRQIGLVAQDVESYFPELVQTDNRGFKSVNYSKMTAVLLEAIKELKKENEELKVRLDVLEGSNNSK